MAEQGRASDSVDTAAAGEENFFLSGLTAEQFAESDRYMHLADLPSYLEADRRLIDLYAIPDRGAHMAVLNVASAGRFSSDRTIAEYAQEIWDVRPCPVA